MPSNLLVAFVAGVVAGYSGFYVAMWSYLAWANLVRPRFKAWRVRRAQRLYPIGWRNR